MRNISTRRWPMWGIVILTLLLNVAIINISIANLSLLWLLSITTAIFVIALYTALHPVGPQALFPSRNFTGARQTNLKAIFGNDQCMKPCKTSLLHVKVVSDVQDHHDMNNAVAGKKVNPETVWCIDATSGNYRSNYGPFNYLAFKSIAEMTEVKMIAVRLTNFRNAEGLLLFIETLRKFSDGKPLGIRVLIRNNNQFFKLCHAINKTQITPDFFVVEGSGETLNANNSEPGAAAMPLYEAVMFASQTLQRYGLNEQVKIIAAGRIISGFDMMNLLALGAHSIHTEVTYGDLDRRNNGDQKSTQHLVRELHAHILNELTWLMNISGFRSVKEIKLPALLKSLDRLHMHQAPSETKIHVAENDIDKKKVLANRNSNAF